jgi:hypothetical protein
LYLILHCVYILQFHDPFISYKASRAWLLWILLQWTSESTGDSTLSCFTFFG